MARRRQATPAGRRGRVRRQTRETKVRVDVNLDGGGRTDITTGVGMLDHLLDQVGRHGVIDITINAAGDLGTGPHHTVEDVALGLGRAIADALGEKAGIVRMADAVVPLDEALAQVAVDLSGRGYASLDLSWVGERIGDLPTDLVGHILWTLASEARMTLHARILAGANDHHKAEALFKALGRALGAATRIEPRRAGDKAGIARMADALVPLDEALAQVAVDLSGRGYASLDLSWAGERIGDLPTDLVGHILWTLASEARMTVHARILSGANDHHKAEALFKALGRALGAATRIEPRRAGEVPSTKEALG